MNKSYVKEKEIEGVKFSEEENIINNILTILSNSNCEVDGLMNVFLYGYNYCKSQEKGQH